MAIPGMTNALITVLRGSTTDAFGDPVPSGTETFFNVPATLLETSKTVYDPSTQMPRTIRQITAYVPAYLGVLNTDQIRDELTHTIYMVTGVTNPPKVAGIKSDTQLDLKRITGAGA